MNEIIVKIQRRRLENEWGTPFGEASAHNIACTRSFSSFLRKKRINGADRQFKKENWSMIM